MQKSYLIYKVFCDCIREFRINEMGKMVEVNQSIGCLLIFLSFGVESGKIQSI